MVDTFERIESDQIVRRKINFLFAINGRRPIVGPLAHNATELAVVCAANIIITADRRILTRGGTRVAIYSNCSDHLHILRPGNELRIGSAVRLCIVNVVIDSIVCRIERAGIIRAGDVVEFPIRPNDEQITPEEKRDIATAMANDFGTKVCGLVVPDIGSAEYVQSLRQHLAEIKCAHFRIWIKTSSQSVLHLTDAMFIFNQYDGIVHTFMHRYCPLNDEPVTASDAELMLMHECYVRRHNIILTTKLVAAAARPPLLAMNSAKCIHLYPDGYLVLAECGRNFHEYIRDPYHCSVSETYHWRTMKRFFLMGGKENAANALVGNTLFRNVAIASYHVQAKAIFLPALSGKTVQLLSQLRPLCQIIVLAQSPSVANMLSTCKHCRVLMMTNTTKCDGINFDNIQLMFLWGFRRAIQLGWVNKHDMVILLYRSYPIVTYGDIMCAQTIVQFARGHLSPPDNEDHGNDNGE